MSRATEEKKPNIIDSFMIGARNGFSIGINAMLPGVMFAFVIMQVLNITGLIQSIEFIFQPAMQLLGLPGVAATPLIFSLVTSSGALGIVASLFTEGQLNPTHVAILAPAIMLTGAMLQYMGRVLGTAAVKSRYYPYIMGIAVLDAIIAMVLMRFILLL